MGGIRQQRMHVVQCTMYSVHTRTSCRLGKRSHHRRALKAAAVAAAAAAAAAATKTGAGREREGGAVGRGRGMRGLQHRSLCIGRPPPPPQGRLAAAASSAVTAAATAGEKLEVFRSDATTRHVVWYDYELSWEGSNFELKLLAELDKGVMKSQTS